MSDKQKPILLILGLLILCALIGLGGIAGYSFLRPKSDQQQAAQAQARPGVWFTAPQSGAQVPVEQPVMVHVVARGDNKIARVELWADGQLHAAQDSASPEGISPFPLVVAWQPLSAGTHTLIARAFGTDGARTQSTVNVEATSADDQDADGVADEFDACPDAPGAPSADGCPDRDGDGAADGADGCPDTPGVDGGCPRIEADDRDGDGIPDGDDECPDDAGVPMGGCPLTSDRDGDGVPDGIDTCPDDFGTPETDGCPDRDGDGIPDGADECPDEAGPPESGCPAPTDEDRDGDGVPDDVDDCPDEAGAPETRGCPIPAVGGDPGDPGGGDPSSGDPGDPGDPDTDSDGDGVPDAEDRCPEVPGLPEDGGCPDSDGDGVSDDWDLCPDVPGEPESAGCPPGGPDGDSDGVPDDVDLCPEVPGLPEDGGCPPPAEVSLLPASGEVQGQMNISERETTVAFQALSFQAGDDYGRMYCYPSLAGGPRERYIFEPLGARRWDIAELGSRTLITTLDGSIQVTMECGADTVAGADWGTYWNIGTIAESHDSYDWDGHVITVRSAGGDDGRWFEVQYRLCSGSCEDAAFPAPQATLSHGADDLLLWTWGGDQRRLLHFDIYMDGNLVERMDGSETYGWISVREYEPSCSAQHTFYVVAVGRDGRYSPPSNLVTWEMPTCPRVVRVTFNRILTYDTRDQEDRCLGPIEGEFWVQGSTSEFLDFDGSDYPDGFRLCPNSSYSIADMFNTIWHWGSGMTGGMGGSSSPRRYNAPGSNSVTVEVGPDDDFTFGASLREWDREGTGHVYRTFYDRSRLPIPGNGIRPGRYVLDNGLMRIEVLIDVLVGPEAGSQPDLTITQVEDELGELRIRVFNNASDMTEPQDLKINVVDYPTSEVIYTFTEPNVQIPSGGYLVLGTYDLMPEYGGKVFVLDPDQEIPDGNRDNNTFVTPVTMRVEFVEVLCGAPCESFLNCDSEQQYSFWVGHSMPEGGVWWIVGGLNYPSSGYAVRRTCGLSNPDDLLPSAEDRERYTIEFEMPPDADLILKMYGTELDWFTSDDSMGSISVSYSRSENYGARDRVYRANSTGSDLSSCPDGAPIGWDFFGFTGWWRITRVH